ncbi:cystatin-A-like [Carassius carassius]|uniref:cystatin-A-like n=1 Tax=Carassius carassius TaxID=217509 RepID=UPI0028696AED|nr:cystatin-A-like [Carassius carassius]XP_059405021.1 cystatin-A-like [Carassius carassius]
MPMCGGWSDIKLFDPEVKKICLEVRPMIEKMVGTDFKIFIPLVWSSQVVAGTNYMFKVLVDVDGDGVCVHALIFQPLPCSEKELSVMKIQCHKSIDDPLIPPEHLQK